MHLCFVPFHLLFITTDKWFGIKIRVVRMRDFGMNRINRRWLLPFIRYMVGINRACPSGREPMLARLWSRRDGIMTG